MKQFLVWMMLAFFCMVSAWGSEFAPAVPDLDLPAETDSSSAASESVAEVKKSTPRVVKKSTPRQTVRQEDKKPANQVIDVSNKAINQGTEFVEKVKIDPKLLIPISQEVSLEALEAIDASSATADNKGAFQTARDQEQTVAAKKAARVVFNPTTDRDPTLSPDDVLLLRHREAERLRALEAERQRKIDAERKRLAELERQRQLELERLRDPSREVRGKININGIIGQEVFIGSKVYTVGQSVLGARIVSVQPDAVVFVYKGQKFTKKVQLK